MTDVNDNFRICMASSGWSINTANSCWQPFIFRGFASCAALWLTGLSCLWQRRKFLPSLTAVKASIFTLLATLVIPFIPPDTIPVLRCHPSAPGTWDCYGVRYNTWLLTQYSCSFSVYFLFPFFLLGNSRGPLITALHALLNDKIDPSIWLLRFLLTLKDGCGFPFFHSFSPLHFVYLWY